MMCGCLITITSGGISNVATEFAMLHQFKFVSNKWLYEWFY